MKLTIQHPDTLGAINSSLCVIHCFATPFLFLTQAQTSLVELSTVPLWWQLLNYVFIVVSFFAVFRTVKNSSNQLVTSNKHHPITALVWLISGDIPTLGQT